MGTEIKRKLASVERIQEIREIPGADAIEAFRVLDWWVVDRKGAHKVDDMVVYLAIDSWVPHELAPFLSKGHEPREYNGIKGERLKTIRLRGQISQGLLLDIVDYVNKSSFITGWHHEDGVGTMVLVEEGQDVTDDLGIQKWEPPLPAELAGKARGTFPTSIIPKTDQDRIQNMFSRIKSRDDTYEVSIKLDGSSMTVFLLDNQLRVCSRNMELLIEGNEENSFVKKALEIKDKLVEGYAFQGELIGEGIQGNKEKIKGHEFYVFDVYDIKNSSYLPAPARRAITSSLGLKHVPVLEIDAPRPESVASALEYAEGPSLNAKLREGLVYKSNQDPSFSFKCIANSWLLKNDG